MSFTLSGKDGYSEFAKEEEIEIETIDDKSIFKFFTSLAQSHYEEFRQWKKKKLEPQDSS